VIVSRQAEALLEHGKADDALKAVNDGLASAPDSLDLQQVLDAIQEQSVRQMRSKASVGHYSEALSDLQVELQRHPDLTLESATDGEPGLYWTAARTRLLVEGQYAAELIAVALVLLWLVIRIIRRYFVRPILELRNFDNHDLAPGIEQALQAILLGFGQEGSGVAALQPRVSRPLEGTNLPAEVTKVIPSTVSWVQAIPALIGQIFPRKTHSIGGVLHKSTEQGVGITVYVSTPSKEDWAQTFWANPYGIAAATPQGSDLAPHHALVEYAAIWLLFKLSKPDFKLLGAAEWRSYALFRAGVHAEERSDQAHARRLYARSLQVDINLQAARLNLAMLTGDSERLLVLGLLERAADKAELHDATRYHARYTLAARTYDKEGRIRALEVLNTMFLDIEEACKKYRLRLSSDALDLCQLALGRDVDIKKKRLWQKTLYPALGSFLSYLVPIACAMWAGLTLEGDPAHQKARGAIKRLDTDQYSSLVYFNLACGYSLMAVAPAADGGRGDLDASLCKLQLALWMSPGMVDKIQTDAALKFVRESNVVIRDGKTAKVLFEEICQRYAPNTNATSKSAGAVA
jgi:hypothetical protein